jgi:DNA-binding transcriptional MerR regulator
VKQEVKPMSQDQRSYSVGELARATGLTVRTLQHYDNIGLFPPSGRTDGGRRYYTGEDLLRLSQIVFYKSVGIPLAEIRDKLSANTSPQTLEAVLDEQITVLTRRVNALHFAMSALSASLAIVKAGGTPPFEMLSTQIRAMEGTGLADWTSFQFDAAFVDALAKRDVGTLDGGMELYHHIRGLLLEAVTLRQAGTAPDSPAGLSLGRRWWEQVIQKITDGAPEGAAAARLVNDARHAWPPADRELFEQAEPTIEAALAAFIETEGIILPDWLTERSQDE